MRVLFDQGVPVPLRQALTAHQVSTAYEEGLSEADNGELLRRADAEFEVLITTDQNLRHQQNLSDLHLAILVLPTTSWSKIRDNVDNIMAAIGTLQPGDYEELEFGAK